MPEMVTSHVVLEAVFRDFSWPWERQACVVNENVQPLFGAQDVLGKLPDGLEGCQVKLLDDYEVRVGFCFP